MAFKNVKRHLLQPHPFEMDNGKTYMVPPPSAQNGLLLRSLFAVSSNAVQGKLSRDEDLEFLNEHGDKDLEEIALSPAVVAEMHADGVPEAHIKQASVYALYLWTLGEAAADRYFEVVYGLTAAGTEGAEDTENPKAPKA